MTNKPISRKSNVVVQNLENEVLIYDLTINKAFCLNETSGLVFALCDGTRTVAEISDEMSKQLNDLVGEDLVYLALDELKKNNLLENSEEFTNYFAGMSRREVVKKVGLATMVALPIISSVVAPSAVMAQSCNLLVGLGVVGALCNDPLFPTVYNVTTCVNVVIPNGGMCIPGTVTLTPCDDSSGSASWTCSCCSS